ncbi:GNAT superfamily N-acetyltransferase [Aquimarina sp. EL_43]|uniref:GNAT family N-acetyltransferase n=1 Tax=Aquimarina TaxID=290174 RepID=UPI0004726CCB|nr:MULTISPECIES: GNAT family N-acetyltransferase [Aquimarina]MBG6132747.1 GNAT superfamily N-acetyltransferase [Aquimarina sp. EL_35]MBG6153176.1 GNAT superfamily N-acetyltransferase [Aquimarina sp. EL_32]MBG6171332.1 GNAT superfamily N-acetyltransferase [Aquimarina sp. EL_43]
MNYVIRDAKEEDMTQVLGLIQELAIFEKEPDAVEITVEELIREGFGDHPLFHCFVAEVKDEIVGIALVYYRFSTWQGRSVHLEDLIVKESMRGTGLGSALYKEVLKYAQSKGVRRVEWVVLDWNTPAIDFYEKSGAKLLKDWYLVQMDQNGVSKFISES